MSKVIRSSAYAFLIFHLLYFVTACSGSDSGSGALPSETQIPKETDKAENVRSLQIEGNIIKGPVKNAQVDIYTLENGVVNTASLVTVYSDAAGKFDAQIEVSGTSSMLFVKASGLGGQETTMLCDAAQCGSTEIVKGEDSNTDGVISFGESVYLSEAFELSTAVAIPDNSDSLGFSITPLTHVAVVQAEKEGDLSAKNIERHMALLASLMNLPASLSQMTAVGANEFSAESGTESELDKDTLTYSVYSAVFAEYANAKQLSIEAAIQDISQNLYSQADGGTFDRNIVLSILQNAVNVARLYAGQDEDMQGLISDIQLVLFSYHCDDEVVESGEDCGVISLPEPPVPSEEELETVKTFVSDLRGWARDATVQAEPAVEKFTNRLAMVNGVWDNELSVLTRTLNQLLPGVAQIVSPYYCSYYEYCPLPETVASGHRRLEWRGVEYNLYTDDGVVTMKGRYDDKVDVDMDLKLPGINDWNETHTIGITAGRLSYGEADLVLTEGSEIEASFANDLAFSSLMRRVSNSNLSLNPLSLRFKANFFLQAEIAKAIQSTVDFEPNSEGFSPVEITGDWSVTRDRAHSGVASLRSKRISHRQSSRASASFKTFGGNLVFYRSVESEERYDYLRVYLDGRQVLSVSGNAPGFVRNSFYVPPGEHTVVWEYSKDGSVNRYADAAWIDQIIFPPLDNPSLPTEYESRTIMNGSLELTAYKLDAPWAWSTQGYIPGDININATLSNAYEVDYVSGENETGRDEIALRLSANFANAADFVPPQPLDIDTLSVLGEYSFDGDVFSLLLPGQRIEIEKESEASYRYYKYIGDSEEPVETRWYYLTSTDLRSAAGSIVQNSGIGWPVIVPEEGLYLTTLIGSSPWATYSESRFDQKGGNIFGFLVQNYEPTETEAQYLRLSAAIELELDIEGLQNTTIGTAITRSSLNNGELGFYIEFDGHRFNVESDAWYAPITYGEESEYEVSNPTLKITNQDGVELDVALDLLLDGENDDENKESFKGSLKYKGTEYGTLERVKGLTIIRYIDGSGESLE